MASTVDSMANTPVTYGGVTKTFHWLTALLILTAMPLGVIAYNWPLDTGEELAVKVWLFSMHKTVGVAAFFVGSARILWALTQPKPGLLNADKKLESWAAETVHWLLYASLVIVPLSGWIHHAATSGFAPIWWPFGQNLPLVPKSEAVAGFFGAWHYVFTKVLGAAVLLHIAGAIKHHVIDRDDTLRRMLPGRTAPEVPAQHHSAVPLYSAAGIYVVAIALGSALGLAKDTDREVAEIVPLGEGASGWAVDQGTLAITVRQFGSDVSGAFESWNAAIEFNPAAEGPNVGTVDVQIAVGSLTLGGVSTEALSPDFLDAAQFPSAQFTADIIKTEFDGEYIAEGTLAMRDVSVPVSMPFSLTLEGDQAQAFGALLLDRREFGVGESYGDETTVGYDVLVDISLTATRVTE